MQNAPREHSAIHSTFIKLPFVFKTFVLSIFEWPLKTGFTVNMPAYVIIILNILSSSKGSGEHVQSADLTESLLLTYTKFESWMKMNTETKI